MKQRTTRVAATVKLTGLAGVDGELEATQAHSRAYAMVAIHHGTPVVASGTAGSLHLYRDDRGHLRCEFMSLRVTIDTLQTKRMGDVQAWLKAWWPKLGC